MNDISQYPRLQINAQKVMSISYDISIFFLRNNKLFIIEKKPDKITQMQDLYDSNHIF